MKLERQNKRLPGSRLVSRKPLKSIKNYSDFTLKNSLIFIPAPERECHERQRAEAKAADTCGGAS